LAKYSWKTQTVQQPANLQHSYSTSGSFLKEAFEQTNPMIEGIQSKFIENWLHL